MTLSTSERRRLAEIEDALGGEDPRFARMMSDWRVGPAGSARLIGVGVGFVVCLAMVTYGAVVGSGVGAALALSGAGSLLIVLVIGTWLHVPRQRSIGGVGGDPLVQWPPVDDKYLWYALWCWFR